MFYSIICNDIENKYLELWNTLRNRVINEGDGTYYRNHYYLAAVNNNPMAVYINGKNIIHIVKLEKKRTQEEFILKGSEGLKHFETITATPKEIIDMAQNKEDFLNQNITEINL